MLRHMKMFDSFKKKLRKYSYKALFLLQTSSLNISVLNFEYKRTFECECEKTIQDFELIFWLNLVHRIRIGRSLADFVYGSQILIYIREIWKKAILDQFLTKGAISRHLTPRRQNSQHSP